MPCRSGTNPDAVSAESCDAIYRHIHKRPVLAIRFILIALLGFQAIFKMQVRNTPR